MGRLRLLRQDGIELDGFPLEIGDGIAISLLGSWVSGMIVYDEHGWYLLTKERRGTHLQTGQKARLLWLSAGKMSEQSWARMGKGVFSECGSSP